MEDKRQTCCAEEFQIIYMLLYLLGGKRGG
jgi:hypothetical protein